MSNLIQTIRIMREMRQWSQEQMAEKVNMSLNGYAKIEQGKTKLTLDKLEKIAQIFDMDILEFMQNTDKGICFLMNGSADNNTVYYGVSENLQAEIDKLKIALQLKDELLANKDALLEQQKSEINTLKEMIALIKNNIQNKNSQ